MTTPDKPKDEEVRMRAFIHWKLKEKDLCEDDRVMWQEFQSVLEAKDHIITELEGEIAEYQQDIDELKKKLREKPNG